jgi:glycosyltransferase involved in cell wall biosynthesis
MSLLLEALKRNLNIEVLSYDKDPKANYSITPNKFRTKFQQILSLIKVSNGKSSATKIMERFDLVHLQHSYLFNNLSSFNHHKTNKPKLVITLRGGDTYIKPWIYPRWKDFYKSNSSYIDAFITVSEDQKKYLQRWGVPKNKIHVIPVSFGLKSKAVPKYPDSSTIKIVSAHRMCWEKNIEGNLRVVKLLIDRGYNVQYDIYGDGPDKGQVHYLTDKYQLNEVVTIHGKIDNASFKEQLKNFDFFLQLSHSEAFGASVIEAQSMGIPCIVSNSGGLPEAIIAGKTGYCLDSYNTVKASDYIEELFRNKEIYHSFSNAAIENSNKKFTIQKEVQKLKELYVSLIKN